MSVILGVILHALGGFASGSFYIPYKKVRGWAWESYWLVGGLFSWIAAPLIFGLLTVPSLFSILSDAPVSSLMWSYIMGMLWGIGGLTFGLSMRYLGLSLGMSIALGYCSFFGTIIPPIWDGRFGELLNITSGVTILLGLVVCLVGIAICGWAGMRKEKEVPEAEKKASIQEFNFGKGLAVATFSGIMSSCMAFGLAAGKPIAQLAIDSGVNPLWQNNAVLVIVLLGGLTTNLIWSVYLNIKNKTAGDYTNAETPLASNYLFCAMAGTTWYLQFFFYGMGSSQMGRYDFSSWTLHMAFIITFSNLWGLYFREWKGSTAPTMRIMITGIVVVILSTVIVGYGNYLGSLGI
jgi:L-rhamnose-H+ transport protein